MLIRGAAAGGGGGGGDLIRRVGDWLRENGEVEWAVKWSGGRLKRGAWLQPQ